MACKLQFSLRWMFATVAAAALIAAEAAAFPPNIALAVGTILSVVFPAVLVAGIVYSRGIAQAFCIGALVALLAGYSGVASVSGLNVASGPPLSTAFYSTIPPSFYPRGMNSFGVEFSLRWILGMAGGLMAVVVRWLAAGGGNAQPRSGDRI